MRLYVANATPQNHVFMYRLPEKTGEYQLSIPPGSQVRLPQELSKPDIDSIIEQRARYGFVEARTARSFRQFSALCYSVDKPVVHEAIHGLILHNQDVLVERGKEIRRAAGVAIHQNIEEQMFRTQMPDRLVAVEATAQEDSREPEFAEGVRVSSEVTEGEPIIETKRSERPREISRPTRSKRGVR